MADWFSAWDRLVDAVDFVPARALFDPGVVSFGTRMDTVKGLETLERDQWRRVWPTIRGFRFDLSTLECLVSPDLSDDDLRDADVLVLIYPDKPWREGQLERIWAFVRRGGSLLVLGEHTIREPDVSLAKGGSRFNEVLQPTAIRVRFDSAVILIMKMINASGCRRRFGQSAWAMTIALSEKDLALITTGTSARPSASS